MMVRQTGNAEEMENSFTPAERRKRIIVLINEARCKTWEGAKHLSFVREGELFRTKPYGCHGAMNAWLQHDKDINLAPSTCSELSLAYPAAKKWCKEYGFDPVESSWPEPSLITPLRKAENKLIKESFEELVRDLFEPEDGMRLTRKELQNIIHERLASENDQDNEDDEEEEEENEEGGAEGPDDGGSEDDEERSKPKNAKKNIRIKSSDASKKASKKTATKEAIARAKATRNAGKADKNLLSHLASATDSLKSVARHLSKIDLDRLIEGHQSEKRQGGFRENLQSALQGWAYYFLRVQGQSEDLGDEFAIWYGYESDMPENFAKDHKKGYQPLIAEPQKPVKL